MIVPLKMEEVLNLKRQLSIDFSLCIFCQNSKTRGDVFDASVQGFETLRQANRLRRNMHDSKNIDIIDRLDNLFASDQTEQVLWHKSCYSTFTDKNKLERLRNKQNVVPQRDMTDVSTSSNPTGITLRKDVKPVDWKLCIFCQSVETKTHLRSVMTKKMSEEIINSAYLDHNIGIRLAGVIDLIAAEAKYHLMCFSSFTRTTTKVRQQTNTCDLAMIWLCKELCVSAERGHILNLEVVWERYVNLAGEADVTIPDSFYSRRSTFKAKVQSLVGNSFTFFQPLDKEPAERKMLLIPTKYEQAAFFRTIQEAKDFDETFELPQYQQHDNIFLSLVHVALKIRKDMTDTGGHKGFCVSDEDARACIPDSLYMFLKLLYSGQAAIDECNVEEEDEEELLRTKILSVAQDLVYGVSGGKKWTPKHIGLSCTLHQATRSKDLVKLFHNAGHCLSYKETLQVDTALAESTLNSLDEETGTVIPLNISSGPFLHFTADNIDILDETLDGKNTFHATQMAVWQRGTPQDVTLKELKPASRHTMTVPDALLRCHHSKLKPGKCEPTYSNPRPALHSLLNNNSECVRQCKAADMAFTLLRQSNDLKVSWTAFNQQHSNENPEQTSVGYLPIILSPAHEMDTLNTVVRRSMVIAKHFNQEHVVITVDQALFCKLMELKWSVPEYLDKLFPRLGGLHIAMNFMKVIGDHMDGSGLEEIWVESGILGPGTVKQVMCGKAYNKGLRCHKLSLQALWHILVPSLLTFCEEHDPKCHKDIEVLMNDKADNTVNLVSLLAEERFQIILTSFIKSMSDVNSKFWWNYMEMVGMLLLFIRAQREGNWDLHLYSFKMMLPYFFRYDHVNYARWGVVYVDEMQRLPQALLDEFKRGNFVIKCSDQKFNQVDPDQGQEWINGTGKRCGGIVGITRTTSALTRWTLTYNLRSRIATDTREMYRLSQSRQRLHKECGKSRMIRDNKDEFALLAVFTGFHVFRTETHQDRIMNIATKDVATTTIKDSLLQAYDLGKKQTEQFIEERFCHQLPSGETKVSIHAPLHRNNATTFATLYTVKKVSKDKLTKTLLKADRNVLQRLIIAYEAGRAVDLPTILKHELMPVPLSIAEMNGSLRSGNKAQLADILTDGICCPEEIDDIDPVSSCLIIDGQAMIVALGKPPGAETFGDLADVFVRDVLKSGYKFHRIEVIFDRYREESIKSATRERRCKTARPIRRLVEDRTVKLPSNWSNFMALSENKADLAQLLSEELISNAPGYKEVIVAGGFEDGQEVKCSKATVDISCVTQLRCNHEEADTRLVLHALYSTNETVVVSSRDTDVLVLLVAHYPLAKCKKLWMVSGTSGRHRYIPIDAVYNKLPPTSAPCLLTFHALTGCDTTSYFANHTKKSAWKIFNDNHQLLCDVGIGELTRETVISVEKFVCRVYNIRETDAVDSARYLMFSKTKKTEHIPPTSDALYFHLLRVHYQCMVWKNAHIPTPILPEPTTMGWKREGRGLKPILMSKSPIPDSCLQMISCSCKKKCMTLNCKCVRSHMPCTSMCSCAHNADTMNICMNT